MKRSGIWAYKSCLFFLAAIFLATGCVGATPTRTDDPVWTNAAKMLADGLYERGENLESFVARGRADYQKDKQRNFFRFEFVSQKPGRMILTAFDPAGRPAFKLRVAGGALTCVLYSARQYATGPATAENLARFLPVNFTPDNLLALMTGAQVKASEATGVQSGSGASVRSELRLRPDGAPNMGLRASDPLWVVKLKGPLDQDPLRAVLESAESGPKSRPFSIKYASTQDLAREDLPGHPDQAFPYSVAARWDEGNGAESLAISYDEVRLGAALPRNVFDLEKPQGFEHIVLP